jgi:hypothetical protein
MVGPYWVRCSLRSIRGFAKPEVFNVRPAQMVVIAF